MANDATDKRVNDLLDNILNSDEVIEARLIQELTECDRDGHSLSLIKSIIEEYLWLFNNEPDWLYIVEQLLKANAFRSAREITLSITDKDMAAKLIFACMSYMFAKGQPFTSRRLSN